MKVVNCLFIIGLSICILGLTGCGSKPVQKEPISIAVNVWTGQAHVYLAQEKGIFEKNNVEVKLISVESITESSQLFTNGEVDGSFGVLTDTITFNAKGIPAKIVYITDYSDTGDVIIGKPDIQSLAELSGKTVSFEGVNSFSHIFVLNALEKAGVHESDVRFRNINAFDVPAALEENRIDAGHTWEPGKTQLLEKGYKILARAGDYPGIITDVLFFNTEIIEERPDEIGAIVKSLYEALDYLKDHRDESVKIMADKMGMSEEEMAAGLEGVYQPNAKESSEFLTTSLYTTGEMIADFYLKRGQLSHAVEIKDIIEPKFIAELANK
ncbi:ABC transporter substrate-binding protein [Chloroflexota bacterium]